MGGCGETLSPQHSPALLATDTSMKLGQKTA